MLFRTALSQPRTIGITWSNILAISGICVLFRTALSQPRTICITWSNILAISGICVLSVPRKLSNIWNQNGGNPCCEAGPFFTGTGSGPFLAGSGSGFGSCSLKSRLSTILFFYFNNTSHSSLEKIHLFIMTCFFLFDFNQCWNEENCIQKIILFTWIGARVRPSHRLRPKWPGSDRLRRLRKTELPISGVCALFMTVVRLIVFFSF